MTDIRVKICFLLDCTASMGPWIHQTKTKMSDMVRDIHPGASIQTAFVGYRDYGDKTRILVHPFQEPSRLMKSIRSVRAEGGDDDAEDVVNGLENALHHVDWLDADVKMLVHIADAPPHGVEFHPAFISDRYPLGDPSGLDPRDFVEKFSFADVDYTFVRITYNTDMMIEKFAKCYTHGGTFRVIDLEPQLSVSDEPCAVEDTLMSRVSQYVNDSITQHISEPAP